MCPQVWSTHTGTAAIKRNSIYVDRMVSEQYRTSTPKHTLTAITTSWVQAAAGDADAAWHDSHVWPLQHVISFWNDDESLGDLSQPPAQDCQVAMHGACPGTGT
jgi:hypothetical protein